MIVMHKSLDAWQGPLAWGPGARFLAMVASMVIVILFSFRVKCFFKVQFLSNNFGFRKPW